ncbi:hypothetical protein CC79DRAFT_1323954 [Sarocladium strictum]
MASAALPLGPTVFPPRLIAKNSLGFTFNYTLYDADTGKGIYFVRFPKVLFGSSAQTPSHVLHNGPREKDVELASASYVDEEGQGIVIVTSVPGRRGTTAWRFTPDVGDEDGKRNSLHRITGSYGDEGPQETYEWRYVKGSEAIREVGAHGFEMVRRTSGRADVVAVLGFKAFSVKKRYTFAFVGDGANLGREFEIMAVMSMLRVEYLFQEAARS